MKLAVLLLLTSIAFAQDVKRPSAELDAGAIIKCGAASKVTSSAMPLAYDAAGQSTSSSINAQGSMTTGFYSSRTFQSWHPPSASYAALTLNVNSSATTRAGTAVIRYSTDGGGTWTDLISSALAADQGGWTRQTSIATISDTVDFSQLQVAVCALSPAGGNQQGPLQTITIYDIWTAGTTTPQGSGSGATGGSPQRGLVIVN